MKESLISITSREKRCAILSCGKLQDLILERKSNEQLAGNIYRGEVINILHNIKSAFININEEENGFIHIRDILENIQKFQEMFDMDFDREQSIKMIKPHAVKNADISKFMKIGHPVLVQVIKDPIGSKGARLTSNISIPGRYLVLLPNTPHKGVSRKITGLEKARLTKLIKAFEMPQSMGLICRTASVNVKTNILIQEANELLDTWNKIQKEFHDHSKPACLYKESNLIKKTILKAVDKKFNRILIDDYKTFQYARRIYARYKNEHTIKLEYYRDKMPMFKRFMIENEIDRCLQRKIWLGNSGYLFFDKTEAMYTIDVNSGRSTSSSENIDVEETLVQINMEAAREIGRQLRLRNIGGLIICDFIDMNLRKNQRRVLKTLKETLRQDSAKCTVLGMSDFGLVEMTRQRTRESLVHTLFTHCPYCSGLGAIKKFESTSIEIERAIKSLTRQKKETKLKLITHPEMDAFMSKSDKKLFESLVRKERGLIEFGIDDELHLNRFEFYSLNQGNKLDF